MEIINTGFGKCILNMPTGTGKTRTAMEAVCYFLIEHPRDSIVWVAHSSELLDQAALEFTQIWEYLGNRPIQIVRHYGNKTTAIPTESSFIVISFQTLLKHVSAFKGRSIGLVIIDEAHMAVAQEWGKAIRGLRQPVSGTRVLGLTATPIRSSSEGTDELMKYFKRIIPLSCPKDIPISQFLIREGILAEPEFESIEGVDINLPVKKIKEIRKKHKDLPPDFLVKLAKDVVRNHAIVTKLRNLFREDPTRNILFFAINVEHSKMIAVWLLKNNIPAFHLDANVDLRSRKACIEAFRKGKIQVLCNYGVLSTGFDAPKVDCVFISRPTASAVLHSQMIGRGLRGPRIGGTERCLIVEVKDNIENYAEDFLQSFDTYRELWDQTRLDDLVDYDGLMEDDI